MSGFTPGPWKVMAERWVYAERDGHDGPIFVAPTYWMEHAPEEAAANARLIAAAPALYEALKAMFDRWEPDSVGTDRRMWEDASDALALVETLQ